MDECPKKFHKCLTPLPLTNVSFLVGKPYHKTDVYCASVFLLQLFFS